MCTEKQILVKNVYKWTKNGFAIANLVVKTAQIVKTHLLSDKEKVKKVMLTVFWDIKGPVMIDFLEKGAIVNGDSYCQLIW